MATGPKYKVKFRREREGKTNYRKRLAMLKSNVPRMIVRISNKNVLCQMIIHGETGDKILFSGSSKELVKLGWSSARCNLPVAYLTGYLCGKKAKKAKVEKAILDLGFTDVIKGSRVFASLKGAVDAGVDIPHDASVFPPQERIEGAHMKGETKSKMIAVKKAIDSKF